MEKVTAYSSFNLVIFELTSKSTCVARIIEHPLSGGGLPGIDVGHNANVTYSGY